MFMIAQSDRVTFSNQDPCALEVRVSSSALGPRQTVMDLAALGAAVRRVVERVAPAEAPRSAERLAERLATLIAEQLAALPPDAAPPQPAWLRVRIARSPETWAAFERPLLPTPAVR